MSPPRATAWARSAARAVALLLVAGWLATAAHCATEHHPHHEPHPPAAAPIVHGIEHEHEHDGEHDGAHHLAEHQLRAMRPAPGPVAPVLLACDPAPLPAPAQEAPEVLPDRRWAPASPRDPPRLRGPRAPPSS